MKLRRLLSLCALLCFYSAAQAQTNLPLLGVGGAAAGGTVSLLHISLCLNIGSGADCAITTTGTSHGLFVLIQSNTATGTVTAVTDGGDTFSQVTSGNITCQSVLNDIWYTPSTGGARTVINITTSLGTVYVAAVYEASGTNASAPLDQHATVSSSGTNTPGAPVTTTAASELIITTETVGGTVSAVTSPFTFDSSQNGGGWASVVPSSTGTYTPNWTNSGAGANCGTTASFKP